MQRGQNVQNETRRTDELKQMKTLKDSHGLVAGKPAKVCFLVGCSLQVLAMDKVYS